MAVPTVIIEKNGQVLKRFTGLNEGAEHNTYFEITDAFYNAI